MKFRRIETVEAFAYDGTNRPELEEKLREHLGIPELEVDLFNGAVFGLGSWLVLQPNGRWQVLPGAILHRLYSPVSPDGVARSCFSCIHYGLFNGRGHCGIFDEAVHSEKEEARNCTAYEVES